MIAAMMPEGRFSGIALAKLGSFVEVVHGPDFTLGKSTDLAVRSPKSHAAVLLAFSGASYVTALGTLTTSIPSPN
jgi:hypothetical protein